MPVVDFILASTSPRRQQLLEQIGARFKTCTKAIDESPVLGESPTDYVTRLAIAKAQAVMAESRAMPVLAADTIVVIDGELLGKPNNQTEGIAMLQRLSGRSHTVLTGVAMLQAAKATSSQRCECRLSSTTVTFATLSHQQCLRYWQSGEPTDKAGGYGIQGMAAVFVEKIAGSYSGVVGLPLAETRELLECFDIHYWHPPG